MSRPTKLTPEVQAAIAENVLHGATYRDSAEACGVSIATFNLWMQKGREQKSGVFRTFLDTIEEAK